MKWLYRVFLWDKEKNKLSEEKKKTLQRNVEEYKGAEDKNGEL